MREMKNSGIEWIGNIPDHWSLSKISGLYSLRNEKVSDKDYPPLSVTNKGILPQLETAAKTNDGDNRKLVKVGDFAINSRSDRRGSCGISPYDGSVSLINIVMTPRKEMVPTYFEWLFHTVQFGDENYRWGHGIVDDLWTTGWQEMKKITIPFPPLAEQKSIATYLDTKCAEIDALTADIQTQIDTLEQYKRSVITEAVTKGLNPDAEMKDSGISIVSQIPSTWKTIKAGYLFKEDIRPYKKNDTPLSLSQQDGLIPTDDMKESSLKTASYDNWKHVMPEDLVLNRFKAHLGVFFVSKYEGCVSFHYGVYHAIRDGVSPKFYEYLFHSEQYKSWFAILSNGITVGLQNLSNQNFYNATVLQPPYQEQLDIVAYLDNKIEEINFAITQKQEQLKTLESYKKSLIYEYVTGKKEVPAAESDVIAVIFDPELVQAYIAHKLGKDNEKGKVYSHKVKYLLDYHIGLGLNIAYTRNYRGPHDVNLDTYIDSIISKGWYRKQKKDGAEILVNGKNYTDFINNHSDIFNQYESDIDNLIKYLKTLTRGQIERIATLYAVWNDFIIDGKTNPTEEEIITEVVTNWTKNKANFQHTTWQESLNQMKQHGIIPKGQGLHTIVKA